MVHGEDNPTLDIGLCGWSDGPDAVTPANTTSADNVTSSDFDALDRHRRDVDISEHYGNTE